MPASDVAAVGERARRTTRSPRPPARRARTGRSPPRCSRTAARRAGTRSTVQSPLKLAIERKPSAIRRRSRGSSRTSVADRAQQRGRRRGRSGGSTTGSVRRSTSASDQHRRRREAVDQPPAADLGHQAGDRAREQDAEQQPAHHPPDDAPALVLRRQRRTRTGTRTCAATLVTPTHASAAASTPSDGAAAAAASATASSSSRRETSLRRCSRSPSGTIEQQPGDVAGLGRGDQQARGAGGDVQRPRDRVEQRLGVVEVRDGRATGDGEQDAPGDRTQPIRLGSAAWPRSPSRTPPPGETIREVPVTAPGGGRGARRARPLSAAGLGGARLRRPRPDPQTRAEVADRARGRGRGHDRGRNGQGARGRHARRGRLRRQRARLLAEEGAEVARGREGPHLQPLRPGPQDGRALPARSASSA